MTQSTEASRPLAAPPVLLGYQSGLVGSNVGVWKASGALCVSDGVVLPPCCVKCNSTDGVTMKRKTFTWYPPWVGITILVALLLFVVLALVLQKKITITYGLCAKHRARARNVVLISVGAVLLSLGMFFLAAVKENLTLVLTGIVLFFGGLIFGAIAGPVLRAKTITSNKTARFTGAGAAFLATLPAGPMV